MFLAVLKPLVLVSTIALSTLGVLSRKYRRARYVYHLTLYAGTLGFMSVAGVFISLVATVVGQNGGADPKRYNINYLVARSFYGLASPLTGVKLVVEGEEHLRGRAESAVLVGNHQSFFDILFLGRIFPKRASIMAKRELIWAPLLGQYLLASGAVFVDRKNRKNALAAMSEAGEDMKRRRISLWVFPEGTRSSSPTPSLLPFKKGAFHLAVQAQIPIIPIICENYHRLFDGSTRFDSGELRIRVLPPILTKGLSLENVSELAEETRRQMLEALIDISEPGPETGSATRNGASGDETKRTKKDGEGLISGVRVEKEQEKETDAGSPNGESTDDEMDEDAVLLKRPRGN